MSANKKNNHKKHIIMFTIILLLLPALILITSGGFGTPLSPGTYIGSNPETHADEIAAETPVATPEPTPAPQNEFELVETTGVYCPILNLGEKIAYLTFDDGPSYNVTPAVLDTLKEYNVKATFFLLGSCVDKYPQLVQRIYEEGHSIGNHSYTHVYKKLYATTDALIEEISTTQNSINTALGFDYKNRLFRFPGGSHDKKDIFKKAVYDNGFQYIDWNCAGNDSVSKLATVEQILGNVVRTSKDKPEVTVLLHDATAKTTTAEALPKIIEYFIAEGYDLRPMP